MDDPWPCKEREQTQPSSAFFHAGPPRSGWYSPTWGRALFLTQSNDWNANFILKHPPRHAEIRLHQLSGHCLGPVKLTHTIVHQSIESIIMIVKKGWERGFLSSTARFKGRKIIFLKRHDFQIPIHHSNNTRNKRPVTWILCQTSCEVLHKHSSFHSNGNL